jgi:hypothetical protein
VGLGRRAAFRDKALPRIFEDQGASSTTNCLQPIRNSATPYLNTTASGAENRQNPVLTFILSGAPPFACEKQLTHFLVFTSERGRLARTLVFLYRVDVFAESTSMF